MAIDIWPWAANRDGTFPPWYTIIDLNNPANESWTINTVDLWYQAGATWVKVATFYFVSWTVFAARDSVTIWNVTSGSKQTFSWLNLSVEAWDFIWVYHTFWNIERSSSWFAGIRYASTDLTNTSAPYTFESWDAISVYGYSVVSGNTTNFFQMF